MDKQSANRPPLLRLQSSAGAARTAGAAPGICGASEVYPQTSPHCQAIGPRTLPTRRWGRLAPRPVTRAGASTMASAGYVINNCRVTVPALAHNCGRGIPFRARDAQLPGVPINRL